MQRVSNDILDYIYYLSVVEPVNNYNSNQPFPSNITSFGSTCRQLRKISLNNNQLTDNGKWILETLVKRCGLSPPQIQYVCSLKTSDEISISNNIMMNQMAIVYYLTNPIMLQQTNTTIIIPIFRFLNITKILNKYQLPFMYGIVKYHNHQNHLNIEYKNGYQVMIELPRNRFPIIPSQTIMIAIDTHPDWVEYFYRRCLSLLQLTSKCSIHYMTTNNRDNEKLKTLLSNFTPNEYQMNKINLLL